MMMNKLFTGCSIALLIAFTLASCSKDKFASRPSLTFKSISSYDIPYGGLFEIKLEYTDAEGDLSVDNDALLVRRYVARCPSDTPRYAYKLPAVPESKNASGEIVIRYENGTLNYTSQGYGNYPIVSCPSGTNTDTTIFRFFIKDKKGQISDTVTIDKPVLIRRS